MLLKKIFIFKQLIRKPSAIIYILVLWVLLFLNYSTIFKLTTKIYIVNDKISKYAESYITNETITSGSSFIDDDYDQEHIDENFDSNNNQLLKKPISDMLYYKIFNNNINLDLSWNDKINLLIESKPNIQNSIKSLANYINHNKTKTKIPHYFIKNFQLNASNNNDNQNNDQNNDQNNNQNNNQNRYLPLIFDKFDYRMTLGVYLNYIKLNLINNNYQNIEIPFDWYDFVDLTILNNEILVQLFIQYNLFNNSNFDLEYIADIYKQHNSCSIFVDPKLQDIDPETFFKINELLLTLNLTNNLNSFNKKSLRLSPNQSKNMFSQSHVTTISCRDLHYFKFLTDYLNSDNDDNNNFSFFHPKLKPYLGFNLIDSPSSRHSVLKKKFNGKAYLYNYNNINNVKIRPFKIIFINENFKTLNSNQEIKKLEFNIKNFEFLNQNNNNDNVESYDYLQNHEKLYPLKSQRLLENGYVNGFLREVTKDKIIKSKNNDSYIYIDPLDEFNEINDILNKSNNKNISFLSNSNLKQINNNKELEQLVKEINKLLDSKDDTDPNSLSVDAFVFNIDLIINIFEKLVDAEKLQKDLLLDPPETPLAIEFKKNELKTTQLSKILTPNLLNYYRSMTFSKSQGTNISKYFKECSFSNKKIDGSHYDWRFFQGIIWEDSQRKIILEKLLKNWFHFLDSIDLKSWLAHGSLLSWYFSSSVFPWDKDIDLQMSIKDLNKLCLYYNNSIILEDVTKGLGEYYLDCNIDMFSREKNKGVNKIDARFIDVQSGLYIDITGLSFSNTQTPFLYKAIMDFNTNKFHPNYKYGAQKNNYNEKYSISKYKDNFEYLKTIQNSKNDKNKKNLERNLKLGLVNCRNNHFYELNDLLPLNLTIISGTNTLSTNVYYPKHFKRMLKKEYGNDCLKPYYRNYYYYKKIGQWIPTLFFRDKLREFYSKSNFEQLKANEIKYIEKYNKTKHKGTENNTIKPSVDTVNNIVENINDKFIKMSDIVSPIKKNLKDFDTNDNADFIEENFKEEDYLILLNQDDDTLLEYLKINKLITHHYEQLSISNGDLSTKNKQENMARYDKELIKDGIVENHNTIDLSDAIEDNYLYVLNKKKNHK
ncbi:uncharacterized protein ASCRUDRAFT_74022 [Ascoidea rubescens DSM 1968]|uniref:LicD/FKTN/FKRP nucleotidyltransferase domain-containing protein n=1 Tax=Ascoidea rubescens DSM 1968 TaxID=1344418 RepID=A0A1D2VRZ6_9ASCO|nr:hypothetical protein ASCRUDRAFT_74022 [Ascoidea rubescens DSM 1968]ODV64384.1 hypothetical protein ASCRUDRAFT_74022 [Ascoidea rubescens DSM 1968]